MQKRKGMKNILFIISSILIIGCASESMEFTTAKTALRSEKNFSRAEEWFIKALQTDSLNALVPYIYATEILKQQNRYIEMINMLNEANNRNSNQKLETPFIWEDKPMLTIGDGVQAYKEQEWTKIYNLAIDNYQNKKIDKAIENFIIAIQLLPEEGNTYATLGAIYLEKNMFQDANNILEEGLKLSPNNIAIIEVLASNYIQMSSLYEKGDQKNIYLLKAEKILIKGLELNRSANPGNLLRQLIFVVIDLEKYDQAIEYSMQAIRNFPNDPDIYYNVAVLYQKMGINIFDIARNLYLQISQEENRDSDVLNKIYNELKISKSHFMESKDYFLTVTDLNPDDEISAKAVKEIKKMLKQIDELFLPSVKDMLKE